MPRLPKNTNLAVLYSYFNFRVDSFLTDDGFVYFHSYYVSSFDFVKGGFYSEGVDEFVISSNRQTSLFSWAWILNLWDFKGLKSCPKQTWSVSDGSNCTPFCYLSPQSRFRPFFDMIWALWNITNSKVKLRKIMRFVCLRKWKMHQHLLNKSHL